MTGILIFTNVNDVHAMYISAALHEKKYHVERLFGADMPSRDTVTAKISSDDPLAWNVRSQHGKISGAYDVIWNRRREFPALGIGDGQGEVHPDDFRFAIGENLSMIRGIWETMGPSAFWVNPLGSAIRASRKLLQLVTARDVGFQIPETCMSNDPDEIKHFLSEQKSAGHTVVYKPFRHSFWSEEEDSRAARLCTRKVSVDDLIDDEVMQLTPGIFQRYIPKKHEIRSTFMGRHCVAVALDSQTHEASATDWRAIHYRKLPMSPTRMPDDIYDKCISLMRRLGLVFGCFDFVVDEQGGFVFLEVNEMGQFTWIERVCPDVHLVDMMSEFLISADPDFEYIPQAEPARLLAVCETETYQRLRRESVTEHTLRQPDLQPI